MLERSLATRASAGPVDQLHYIAGPIGQQDNVS